MSGARKLPEIIPAFRFWRELAALALLGMSFLGNFKFEIDAEAGTLEMTQVEIPGSETARKRR